MRSFFRLSFALQASIIGKESLCHHWVHRWNAAAVLNLPGNPNRAHSRTCQSNTVRALGFQLPRLAQHALPARAYHQIQCARHALRSAKVNQIISQWGPKKSGRAMWPVFHIRSFLSQRLCTLQQLFPLPDRLKFHRFSGEGPSFSLLVFRRFSVPVSDMSRFYACFFFHPP